jgi:type VI secretion system protein ImpH
MRPVAEIEREPWRFDFFQIMRRLERSFPTRPRIGEAGTLREEFVQLGQNPYLDFPASNLADFKSDPDHRFVVSVKFLGLLGPQGALPLATTEESYRWLLSRDEAFPRFLDLLNHRFIQLFYRAWADSRPVAQHDRPNEDRFRAYIGAAIGIGSDVYRNLDSVPDSGKLGFAGLIGAKAKSASRLRRLIRGLLHVEAEIEEFVGSRLELAAEDRSMIGSRFSSLGIDVMLGGTCYSVRDKIRIRLFAGNMKQYRQFLPGGDRCRALADLVFFYLGDELQWEVELAIPAGRVEAVRLGVAGEVGWTSWMAPNWTANDPFRSDARFHPGERPDQHGTSPPTR